MNQIQIAAIGWLIGVVTAWVVARWWYKSQYQEVVNDMAQMLGMEKTTELMNRYKGMLAEIKGEPVPHPEIIGEAIIEPEDVTDDAAWAKYKQEHPEIEESWVIKNTNPWTPPDNLKDIVDKDPDRRTPGWHQPAIALLIMVVTGSCGRDSGSMKDSNVASSTVVIEGCQYLENSYRIGNNYNLTHKGNCNNPIHRLVIHDTVYIEYNPDKSKLP
jgi:hypothetical protein